MFELKVFILKLVSINALSSSSIVVGEISSLTHELGNDAVEGRSSETEACFSSAKLTEVLSRLGNYIRT